MPEISTEEKGKALSCFSIKRFSSWGSKANSQRLSVAGFHVPKHITAGCRVGQIGTLAKKCAIEVKGIGPDKIVFLDKAVVFRGSDVDSIAREGAHLLRSRRASEQATCRVSKADSRSCHARSSGLRGLQCTLQRMRVLQWIEPD